MYRLIVIVLGMFLLKSCGENKYKTYYESGRIKNIYHVSNQDTIRIETFYDDDNFRIFKEVKGYKRYDSLKYFYKNGILFKKGIVNKDGLKKGNWYRYTNDGYLSDIREYFIINNKNIINRKFYFNKKGDTLWKASKENIFSQKEFISDTLKLSSRTSDMTIFKYQKDTITLNEPFSAYVLHYSPLFRDYNSETMVLMAKEEFNFNEDFSNEKEVKLDTFLNVKYDKINRPVFEKEGIELKYTVVFGRWFKTPGLKILKGYLKEYFEREPTESDDNIKGEYKVYFEKEIFVKDTV